MLIKKVAKNCCLIIHIFINNFYGKNLLYYFGTVAGQLQLRTVNREQRNSLCASLKC